MKYSRRFLEKNSAEIIKIFEKELTETQKCYIIMYYRDGLTMSRIAARFGVNTSTVSRTIKRGTDRLRRCVNAAVKLRG